MYNISDWKLLFGSIKQESLRHCFPHFYIPQSDTIYSFGLLESNRKIDLGWLNSE